MEESRLQSFRRWAVSLEAAAVMGLLFAGLFVASVSLMRAGLPNLGLSPAEVEAEFNDPHNRRLILVGYSMAPFAAVAFLWFVGVVRKRAPAEDQFVATVFTLASAVFVSLFLVAASLVGGPIYLQPPDQPFQLDTATLAAMATAAYGLLFVIGVRIQVLIVLTATAVGRIHHALPKPLIYFGYLVALVQTLNISFFQPLVLAFPTWVAVVSLVLLRRRRVADVPPDE